jgi:peptidoglycan/LPS O-acetylase OafA/YrhL
MKRLIKKSHFDNINALRFLAFFGIFVSHCFITGNQQVEVSSLFSDLRQVTGNLNSVCYSLLFLLTGFLNTWTIFEERFIYKKVNLLRFYMRRILGMLPLYFVLFILGYYILPNIDTGLPEQNYKQIGIGEYLGFYFNFNYQDTGNPLAGVMGNMWSIAVSFQFILIWPILMVNFRRKETLLMVLAMAAFIASAWMWSSSDTFRYSSLNIICDFIVGSYLAYFSFFKYKLYIFLKKQTRRTIGFIYLAFFAVVIFIRPIRFEFASIPPQLVFIIERVILTLTLGFFVFEQNFSSNSVFKLSKLKIFNYPGKHAYSLYAYHAIGIILGYRIMKFMVTEENATSVLLIEPLLGFAVTFALAIFSHEYFENKFTRRKKNYNPTREYNPVGINDAKTKPA